MKTLRILNLEDDPLDTELLQADLSAGGIDCEVLRVQRREEFVAALVEEEFDLILADNVLPGFDGLSALRVAREVRPELPFIFVSGTIGEEAAIESLKSGATDYVLKHRLERLVPAVRRAMREVQERAERERMEEALFEIREGERRRIARDLHDIVLQDLSAAAQRLQARQLESEAAGSDAASKTEIDALRRAVSELRRVIYDLRFEGERPFVQSVEALMEQNRAMAPDCEIGLEIRGGFPSTPLGARGNELLLILREALTNARRHSGAKNVRVRLRTEGNELVAEVSDDGKGFDAASVREGVGMSAMRERIAALGGELEVKSEPGKGTTVIFRAPLLT